MFPQFDQEEEKTDQHAGFHFEPKKQGKVSLMKYGVVGVCAGVWMQSS